MSWLGTTTLVALGRERPSYRLWRIEARVAAARSWGIGLPADPDEHEHVADPATSAPGALAAAPARPRPVRGRPPAGAAGTPRSVPPAAD
jgi:hypothetical protein